MVPHLELLEILLITYQENPNQQMGAERRNLSFIPQSLELLRGWRDKSRVNYIDKSELEACLLSCSTLSILVRLLSMSEYDLWVREMTIACLDFKNPVGFETFNCFKSVCIIERNTTESSRSDPVLKEVQSTAVKKVITAITGETRKGRNLLERGCLLLVTTE